IPQSQLFALLPKAAVMSSIRRFAMIPQEGHAVVVNNSLNGQYCRAADDCDLHPMLCRTFKAVWQSILPGHFTDDPQFLVTEVAVAVSPDARRAGLPRRYEAPAEIGSRTVTVGESIHGRVDSLSLRLVYLPLHRLAACRVRLVRFGVMIVRRFG